jgi:hypothetical protein
MGFEVLMAVKMWAVVFWAVMPCHLVDCYCFGGTITYTFRVDEGDMFL